MVNHKSVVTLVGAAVLAVVVAAAGASGYSGSQRSHLTFSGPVALPGVTLAAGSYVFEVANPNTSGNVVRVSNRDRRQVVFMGFTRVIERPRWMNRDRLVAIGEAQRGFAPPLLAWYPEGAQSGHEFIYSGR